MPKCCNEEAAWTVISQNMQYWYCKTCKKEVDAPSKDILDEFAKVVLEDPPVDNYATISWPKDWTASSILRDT